MVFIIKFPFLALGEILQKVTNIRAASQTPRINRQIWRGYR